MADERQNKAPVEEAAQTERELSEQSRIRAAKLQTLFEEGRNPYEITTYDRTHSSVDVAENYDALENQTVRIAGRMLSRNIMGKATFAKLQDRDGRIQIYVKRDEIGEEEYAEFKKWDIGDVFGVEGFVFKTRTGEVSVHAKKLTLLTKCLHPLPEKFHGLTDTDTKYRQRYLDLIVNPESRDAFLKRSKIISAIRTYLAGQDFIEVETPMLVNNAGGAAARPFETHFNALNVDLKLRISLELYLNRLIVGGLERVYEIGRVFRNEGMDTRHNPEFTLMELYQAYTDFEGMMDLVEELYKRLAMNICGSYEHSLFTLPISVTTTFSSFIAGAYF